MAKPLVNIKAVGMKISNILRLVIHPDIVVVLHHYIFNIECYGFLLYLYGFLTGNRHALRVKFVSFHSKTFSFFCAKLSFGISTKKVYQLKTPTINSRAKSISFLNPCI